MIRRGATRPHPRTRRGMGAGTVGSGASRRAGSACAAPGGAMWGNPTPPSGWRGSVGPGASGAVPAARIGGGGASGAAPDGGAPDRRADDDARRIAGRRGDGDDPQHGSGGDGGASDAGRPALRRDAPRRRIVAGSAPAAAAARRDAGWVADGDMEPPGCAGRNDDAPQRAAVRVARGAHGEPDVAMQRRRRADAAKRAASAAVTGTMSGACSAPARTGAGTSQTRGAPRRRRAACCRACASLRCNRSRFHAGARGRRRSRPWRMMPPPEAGGTMKP